MARTGRRTTASASATCFAGDNAQRIHETGFGIRLDTYGHQPAELRAAAERLLADASLNERLTSLSRRLQAAPGTARAADLIERAA